MSVESLFTTYTCTNTPYLAPTTPSHQRTRTSVRVFFSVINDALLTPPPAHMYPHLPHLPPHIIKWNFTKCSGRESGEGNTTNTSHPTLPRTRTGVYKRTRVNKRRPKRTRVTKKNTKKVYVCRLIASHGGPECSEY